MAPQTTDELRAALSEVGTKAKILAGGTDLVVLLKQRALRPEVLIDITRISSLAGIREHDSGGLVIGAATKLGDLEHSALVAERYPALHQALCSIGSAQVRAMATLGGNSCNASPAADSPSALMVIGARVVIDGARGRREMALQDFIVDKGKTALEPDEFLESFLLPVPWPNSTSCFAALGLRDGMECSVVNVAANVAVNPKDKRVEQVAIAMGSVGPRHLRATQAEGVLRGQRVTAVLLDQAVAAAADACRPIDDMRATAGYRREQIKILTRRVLLDALNLLGLTVKGGS